MRVSHSSKSSHSLVVVAGVLGAGLLAGLVHEHDDGVVDVVGVFFDQLGQAVLLQVLVVVVVLGVLLDVEHDVGASALLPAGGEGVPSAPSEATATPRRSP